MAGFRREGHNYCNSCMSREVRCMPRAAVNSAVLIEP